MPRKIYDIKPPKVARKTERNIKAFIAEEKTRKPHRQSKKKEGSLLKNVLIGAGVVAVLVCVYLFFTLPKADIQIWPAVQTSSFKQAITADKSTDSIDETKAVIPAQLLESTKTETQDFPATGSADNAGMASGSITVYNKNDPASAMTLKAGTHFLSDSGKLFVTSAKIVVPAATKSGSKVTPGSIQIKVQAAESGPDYNIAPANFSVPKLSGTAFYYSIYAVSTTAMSGGYTGKVKKVTDDDIQGAKDVLTKKATADVQTDLKNQVPSDSVLLDNAITANVTSASTQTKSGAVVDKFTYTTTVKADGLVFKKSDIEKFAKDYIISQVPDGKTLLDNSFKIDYSAGALDITAGKLTLNLNFSAGVYQSIDTNSLSLSLIGKTRSQINDIITSSYGDNVSKVNVKFWPFWVSAAPDNQSKVTIELKFQ